MYPRAGQPVSGVFISSNSANITDFLSLSPRLRNANLLLVRTRGEDVPAFGTSGVRGEFPQFQTFARPVYISIRSMHTRTHHREFT
jgi:hypothetical protein